MPPHGRRRLSSLSLILPFLLLFVFRASAASSAVLGVDLGTEYIKAALVKPGVPLDIVLTKDSKRKETAAVAFKGLRTRADSAESEAFPERIYGSDAVALSARFPKDVYSNLKPLIGLSPTSEGAAAYGAMRPELQMVEGAETGRIGFKSASFVSDEEPFMIEELLAMELKNIKGNAEIMAGKSYGIQDVVITIPAFYSVEERRAVIAAAEMAGLRVLSLISDGLAVGLNYATSRTFPTVNEGGRPENHLVYDMGAGSTTATILKFQGRKVRDIGKFNKTIQEIQVLGTGWDKSLGGDALNSIIVEDIVTKFIDKDNIKALGLEAKQFKSHGRTMAKLWKESERIRQVLSANSETTANFESLYYEDQNLKYKLTRNEFEELASRHLTKVQAPILDALESAKLTFADLDSIILHGGAVRTPLVQKQLEDLVKDNDKIRTNVNSDEAAVLGAGFKAATISPSFRVKEIRASDSAVYPIFASWIVEGKEKQQKLFVPTSVIGGEKQVTIKAIADFDFSLFQQASSLSTNFLVSTITTQNLTESVKALTNKAGCATGDISTKFGIRLSPVDGLAEVVSGSISCEATEVEKKGVVDGMKDFLGFGSKRDEQKPLQDENEASLSSPTSESTTSSATSTSDSTKSDATAEASPKAVEKSKDPKSKIVTISIGLTSQSTSSSDVKVGSRERINKRLTAFDASDRSRVLREEALNNLEGYTYKIRDILTEEGFIAASTSAEREAIEQESNDASTWLYGDGAEANRETLKARLDELRGLVKPITKRKEEAGKRPEALKNLQDALSQAQTMVNVIKNQQQEKSISAAASLSASTTDSQASSPTGSVSSDDFADLDEAPSSSTTTTSAIPETPTPSYSEADLASVLEKQEAVRNWLDEKLPQQEKLGPTEDPVLLSSELSIKAKELNELVSNLIMKSIKAPKPKKAKASTKPAKVKSSSSTTTEPTSTSSTTSEAEPSSTEDSAAEPSPEQSAEAKGDPYAGAWEERSPEPEPGQGLPSPEEQMEIARIQAEIDEKLAADRASIVSKAKANASKKEKKAKPTSKAKSKGKGKAKGKDKENSKGKDKTKEHGEL